MNNFIIGLFKDGRVEFLYDDEHLFTLREAVQSVEFWERMYVKNRGKYKIFRIDEVKYV